MGEFLLNRHQVLEEFFKIIGLEEKILINIELVEHSITNNALRKIKILNSFFKNNPHIHEEYKIYKMRNIVEIRNIDK